MLEGVLFRFRNPYRKPRSQVWEGRMLLRDSEIPIENQHWKVGNPYRKPNIGRLEGNPYRKPRSQVWEGRMLEGWKVAVSVGW